MEQLKWEMGDASTLIGVAVKDGVVTRAAAFPAFRQWAAEPKSNRAPGVGAVAEEIEVRLPGSDQRTDVDIARAAEKRARLEHSGAPWKPCGDYGGRAVLLPWRAALTVGLKRWPLKKLWHTLDGD